MRELSILLLTAFLVGCGHPNAMSLLPVEKQCGPMTTITQMIESLEKCAEEASR